MIEYEKHLVSLLFGVWGLILDRSTVKLLLSKIISFQEKEIATVMAKLLTRVVIPYNCQRNVNFIEVKNPLFPGGFAYNCL